MNNMARYDGGIGGEAHEESDFFVGAQASGAECASFALGVPALIFFSLRVFLCWRGSKGGQTGPRG